MYLSRVALAVLSGLELLLAAAMAGGNVVSLVFAAVTVSGAVAGLTTAWTTTLTRACTCALLNLLVCVMLVALWLTRPAPDAADVYRIFGCLPVSVALLAGWLGSRKVIAGTHPARPL